MIADLEEKNKRLTDLLNSHLYDRAQSYKENVLSKLRDKSGADGSRRPPHAASPSVPQQPTPQQTMDMAMRHQRNRSVTPDPITKRQSFASSAHDPVGNQAELAESAHRLQAILR